MPLTVDEVQHIAELASLGLQPGEAERYRDELARLLDYFRKLQELDTEDVPPTGHSGELVNVTRPDQARDSGLQRAILQRAPRREEDYLLVPPVLDL